MENEALYLEVLSYVLIVEHDGLQSCRDSSPLTRKFQEMKIWHKEV